MEIKKVIVHHVGARDKYLVSKYFLNKGKLDCLITDIWTPALFRRTGLFKKAQRRFNKDLEKACVISFNLFQILLQKLRIKFTDDEASRWIIYDQYFTGFVRRKLKMRQPDLIWGYTNANLEVLEHFSGKEVIKVHNQIDPGIHYYKVKRDLFNENSDFEEAPYDLSPAFEKRVLDEWKLADIIIVNSEFSKESIIKYGGNPEKIIVLPLIVESNFNSGKKIYNPDKKLNIGFVGNINLIKGFKLFLDAAKELHNEMNFYAAGNIQINRTIVAASEGIIDYKGHLSKDEMENFYKNIDILIFPTYCDGFGMVQLEAMAYSIPVLATENCGKVVIDGHNGYIISDTKSIVVRLKKLDSDRKLLQSLSDNTHATIKEFDMEHFDKRIKDEFLMKGIVI